MFPSLLFFPQILTWFGKLVIKPSTNVISATYNFIGSQRVGLIKVDPKGKCCLDIETFCVISAILKSKHDIFTCMYKRFKELVIERERLRFKFEGDLIRMLHSHSYEDSKGI